MYFNLHRSCYLIIGRRGGVIYNLESGEAVHLEQEEIKIMRLLQNENNSKEISFLNKLATMGWGFFSKESCFIDRLRPYNNYLLMRPDLKPPAMEVAFIQLSESCSFSSEHCREMFCTPCRNAQENHKDYLSVAVWKKVIDDLARAGLTNIVLTGGDVTLYEGLEELISYIHGKNIFCSVVLNNASLYPEKISSVVAVVAYICNPSEPNVEMYRRFKQLTVHCNEKMSPEKIKKFKALGAKINNIRTYDLTISKEKLKPCFMNDYFNKKDYNGCFNKRVYIDSGANVIACFQNPELTAGNLFKDTFPDVMRTLINEYWSKPVKHSKCDSCEWYYSCSVCSCLEPEKHCRYDVEQSVWK